MAISKSNAYSFSIFGFHFLVWKRATNRKPLNPIWGTVSGSCKLIKSQGYICLVSPEGKLLPNQIDLTIESNLNDAATATVKLYVDLDEHPTN
jgi:hypothetical protein